jgi:hypothetical protein
MIISPIRSTPVSVITTATLCSVSSTACRLDSRCKKLAENCIGLRDPSSASLIG